MYYPEAYAHLYQKAQGFKIKIYGPNEKQYVGYLSLKPSTRSTYDIAMRDATIDGIITVDDAEDIDLLEAGQIFYRVNKPEELFILQSVNEFEQQFYSRSINAIKQNSYVTIQRKGFDEETGEEKYINIYEEIVSFVTTINKDEKNFAAGVEDNTNISIQIPKRDKEGNLYIVENGDRIVLSNLKKDFSKQVKVESTDEFSVPGVIKLFGTYETRTGE